MIDVKKVKVGDRLIVRYRPGLKNWHYADSSIPEGTIITVGEVDKKIPSVKDEGGLGWFRDKECFAIDEMTLGPGEKLVYMGSLKVGQLFLTEDRDCMAMVTDAVNGPLYDAALVDCGVSPSDKRSYHVCVNIWHKERSSYSPPGTISVWDKNGEDVWVLPE